MKGTIRSLVILVVVLAVLLVGVIPAFASQPPGQLGYEGQPGNQGNGQQGYEGQPGNQGG